MTEPAPSPMDLWKQAGGGTADYDPARYRDLMHDYGWLLRPGDDGYDETGGDLPCGWPGKSGLTGPDGGER